VLSERDYARESDGPRRLTVTAWLTIIFVSAFALQCINDVYLKTPAESWLALTRYGLQHGWVWQILTFQFLHADLFHLIFNMIMFWWLGRFCENLLGTGRFLLALFGCGAVGGILQGVLMLAFPSHFGSAVVGASAGVSGLLAIFALCERDSEVRFNFLIPVPAIWLLWFSLGISLFFTLVPTPREYGAAHAAHLGGLLAGIAWVKLNWHQDFQPLPWVALWEKLQARLQRPNRPSRPKADVSPRWRKLEWEESSPTKPSESVTSDEFIAREVDPILDKMNAKQSLTERERRILEQAGKRINKR
jgi:membrane associated rhomboid family serine protease